MSLISVTHTSVFLIVSSVVTGLPSRALMEWNCPDNCQDEPDHPGCYNTTHGVCSRLKDIIEEQKSMEILVATLKQDSENSAHSLLVMGTALFVFVPILLLGLALIILKLYLPSFFKCFKKRSNPERKANTTQCQYLGQIPSSTQNLKQLTVSTIRLAKPQQSTDSPAHARNRIPRNVPHSTPVTEEHNQQSAPPRMLMRQPSESTPVTEEHKQQSAPPRRLMRQPSESTCPNESSDTSRGCDNLGISTSTLHNQSTSSSNRSLGGVNNSTSTLNTTIPPDTSSNQTNYSTRI